MILCASYAAHAKSIDKRQDNDPCFRVKRFNQTLLLAMKLTSLLLLVTVLQVTGKGFAQGKVTISLRDVVVTEVFKEIEKQTSFRFLYRDELIKRASHVTVSVKDASVQEALNKCFEGSRLDYKIFKMTIVISEKGESVGGGTMEVALPMPLINVTGRVLNEQGKPVEAVTVTIKGSDKSTITNSNGEFFLSSVEQDAVLVFTSVNMETFELRVSGKTELVVNLKAKTVTLGDVEVIHTGYEDVPKERATGSFAKPNKDIYDNRVSTTVLGRLDGITSGLVFYKGTPNGKNEIRVRGQSTIFANAQPLIVVDNFPYEGDIDNINPNDVESITLLKDAAAASIWGVRASNGVIVITTKKGQYNNRFSVQFNSNITLNEKPDLYYSPAFMKSSDFIDVELFLYNNNFYNAIIDDTLSMAILSPIVAILEKQKSGEISSSEAATHINKLRGIDLRKDLERYLFRKAVFQQHSLSISGGTDKANYFASFGYDNNVLSGIGDSYDRISINSHNSFRPIKNLELTTGINYTLSKSRSSGVSTSSFNVYPYVQLANEQGLPLSVVKDYRSSFVTGIEEKGFLDWQYYPLKELELADNKLTLANTRLNFGLKYKILRGLSTEVKYQYEKQISQGRNLYNQESYLVRNLINRFSVVSSDGNVVERNIPLGGILDRNIAEINSHSGRALLNYSNSWGEQSVTAIAGVEVREVRVEGYGSRLYGYDNNLDIFKPVNYNVFYNTYPGTGTSLIPDEAGSVNTINRFRSYFGNAAYSFRDRYTLSASGRIDASNFFGVNANQRNLPLWSVGFKWDIDREDFYHSKVLPTLKTRITYGFNGNLDKSVTGYTTAQYTPGALLTNFVYANILNPANPSLRWEKSSMLNFAVDFAFKKELLSGSIDVYQRRGVDLIGDEILAPQTGFTIPYRGNFSNMKSKGIDINLSSRISQKVIGWKINYLFSYATDKVTHYSPQFTPEYMIVYGNGANSQFYRPLVGKPVFAVYSYRWAGLHPQTGDPLGYDSDHEPSNDYTQLNNPESIDEIVYNGPGRPVIFGGLSNSISWKWFTISASISYKFGYYFARNSIYYSQLFNGYTMHSDFALRWQKQGDELKTNVPSMIYPDNTFGNRDRFYANSEVLVEKGDHIRLQDVSIRFDINKTQWIKLPFSHLQIYTYLNNLGILWRANDKNLDPDFLSGFPTPRSISIGVKADF